MESPWKGLSGMDAARAAMGQGWPFAACLWNGDGANEPGAKRRAGCRGKAFLVTFSASGKSDSPSRAKPELNAKKSAALTYRNPCRRSSRSRPLPHGGSGPSRSRPPSLTLTSTTTPSTPADSPPAAAAPPHWPARCSGRCRSAAARTAPVRHGSPPAVDRRACRSPPR